MSDLVPYVGGGLQPSRTERQTTRALERIQAWQAVTAAKEVARIAIIDTVTETALLAVSHVSTIEDLVIMRTPRSEERFRHIVDAGTMGMTEVVLSTNRKCR